MSDSDYNIEEVLDAYRRDGSLIKEKAKVMVEAWLDRVYPRMVDPDVTTSGLLEIGKVLIELGDLKPKKDITPISAGSGFSITINIPQTNGAQPITIEGTVAPPVDEDIVEAEVNELPPTPNFNTLDFQFNNDLTRGATYEDEE